MSLIEGISVFLFLFFKCKWNAECVSIQKVSLQSSTYLTQSLQSLVKVAYFSLYLLTVPSECFRLWEVVSKEESVFPAICLLQGFLLCLVCRVFVVVVSLLSQNLQIAPNEKQKQHKSDNTACVIALAFEITPPTTGPFTSMHSEKQHCRDKKGIREDRFQRDKEIQEKACCSDVEKQAICLRVPPASH